MLVFFALHPLSKQPSLGDEYRSSDGARHSGISSLLWHKTRESICSTVLQATASSLTDSSGGLYNTCAIPQTPCSSPPAAAYYGREGSSGFYARDD